MENSFTLHSSKILAAVQGGIGSFHEVAAVEYFETEQIDIKHCGSFLDVFDDVLDNKADCGVVAIENSVSGSLLPNYAMLRDTQTSVVGEIYFRIEQHLMALPGQTMDDIKEIISHPVAIQQCKAYLNPLFREGVKMTGMLDTARCAEKIKNENLMGTAAIAGIQAAKMYGLEILARNIESKEQNYTRFLVFVKTEKQEKLLAPLAEINKATLCFTVCNENGELANVLSMILFYKIKLVKVQSMPLTEIAWEYRYYADIVFESYHSFRRLLVAIKPLTSELRVLGRYINAWDKDRTKYDKKMGSYLDGLRENL